MQLAIVPNEDMFGTKYDGLVSVSDHKLSYRGHRTLP